VLYPALSVTAGSEAAFSAHPLLGGVLARLQGGQVGAPLQRPRDQRVQVVRLPRGRGGLRRLELVAAARVELQRLDQVHPGQLPRPLGLHHGGARGGHAGLLLVQVRDGARTGVSEPPDLRLLGLAGGQVLAPHPELLGPGRRRPYPSTSPSSQAPLNHHAAHALRCSA
jgi:hypothetical protein